MAAEPPQPRSPRGSRAAGAAGAFVVEPIQAIQTFAALLAGGALMGAAIGLTAALLLRWIDNAALDVVVTAAVAYGSYVLAEREHCLGIVAVIATGLSCSAMRSKVGSTAQATQALNRF